MLEQGITAKEQSKLVDATKRWFSKLVQSSQYVGEVYSISYETALVQIHDHHRQKVGGIPSLSFLIASRTSNLDADIDYKLEDSSIILLRVMDSAQLPGDVEAERIRVQSAQKVSGEIEKHWDSSSSMDAQTHNLLSFAGVKCRVIGTFFLEHNPLDPNVLNLRFGSDLSNYYPNKGLKVFKPNAGALKEIVNYQDPDRTQDLRNHSRVPIGEIRYASTNRDFQGISNVEVSISPADLLGQKTALFGMTRTGKSNTTKIIAKSVFSLRFDTEEPLRIGQIVFDPNGEYANENVQDTANKLNPSALKNVWTINEKGEESDVVTYGILPHPQDPNRKLMLINFYEEDNLQIGKEMIDFALVEDPAKFIQNFRQIHFERPNPNDKSASTRFNRRVLAYHSLLAKADFTIPANLTPKTHKLFNEKLLEKMEHSESDPDNSEKYLNAAKVFAKPTPSWSALASAFEALFDFMKTKEYNEFEYWYINERNNASGDPWADEDFKKILEMLYRPNGARQIGKVRNLHTPNTKTDYADDIYKHLADGKLVIVDQSSGEPEVNDSSARRIMWKIFRENQNQFREGKIPPDILVYVEEAHTLLPSDRETDLTDVWVRTAKEGAKYLIGMVYVTQEVSSIQRNILKNTSNWFIGHLNNTDETRELKKFYDFADFESSIIRAQDKGFLRVKTLSNLFVIPVQIKKFEILAK